MNNGNDQGSSFVYWRLSYRRKFIRTVWLTAVIVPILFALQVDWFVIGVVLVLAIVQAAYTYYRWQREVASSGDAAVVSRAEELLKQSDAERDRTLMESKMTSGRKWPWLVGGFALCFFVGGAILWRGSYTDYLNNGMPWGNLVLLACTSLLLTWVIGAGIIASSVAIGIALPATVFGRVVIDCMQDPTNHNLWPFEIVISLGLGLITSFLFAALGGLLHRVLYGGQA